MLHNIGLVAATANCVCADTLVTKQTPVSSIPPHQARPFLRPFSTVHRLDGCKCFALLLFVPVAGDAPAVSGAGPPSEGRDWRGRNDGGNNASADTKRTDAPDADRTLRPGGADGQSSDGISGRLNRTPQRSDQPAEHPQRPGAAGHLALTREYPCRFAPAGASRSEQWKLIAVFAFGRWTRPKQCEHGVTCVAEPGHTGRELRQPQLLPNRSRVFRYTQRPNPVGEAEMAEKTQISR